MDSDNNNIVTKHEDDYVTQVVLNTILNDTSKAAEMSYLEDVLQQEDYILYFYASQFFARGVTRLTRDSLNLVLTSNALQWIQKDSLLSKANERRSLRIPTVYLATRTSATLSTQADYAKVLILVVLERFDKIQSVSLPATSEEILSILEGHRIQSQVDYSSKLMKEVYDLLYGTKECTYLNNVRYKSSDVLDYIRDNASIALSKLKGSYLDSSTNDNPSMRTIQNLAYETTFATPTFHWNLGNSILSNPIPGWLITISAPPKEGKTRFVIGEMVYATLCEGHNVKYYSGEMSEAAILTCLIIKHIYAKQGINLGTGNAFKMVYNILVMVQRIKAGTIMQEELAVFNSYGRSKVELVLNAQYDLFLSGKYGGITITYLGAYQANQGDNNSIESQQFVVENLQYNILNEMKSAKEENRYDVVIFDHAGHFRSSQNSADRFYAISRLYNEAKSICTNKFHPFTAVVVNHTTTDANKVIDKSSGSDSLQFRAFGTSDAGKTADMDLSLISTPEQQKDGLQSIIVNFDRWISHAQAYKTNIFPLTANKGICDFCFVGSTKTVYGSGREENSENAK